MVIKTCAICESNKHVRELYKATFKGKELNNIIYSARRLPDKIHYRVVKCYKCGLIFSSPILSTDKIFNLYRDSICTYNRQIPYLIKTYMKLLELSAKHIPKNPKVLEVGCGNAFFLDALYRKGIKKVYGVEPSPKMVLASPKHIRKNILVDVFKKKQFSRDTFDLITCFHTLDHMVDPNYTLVEIHRILKPGGAALIVVHDTDGLSVKLFGEKSPIFDIEHIFLFNKNTVQKIFEKHGFLTEDVGKVKNTYPLWYWWSMGGLPRILKITGLEILKLTRIGNFNFTLSGGNIYILVRKRS